MENIKKNNKVIRFKIDSRKRLTPQKNFEVSLGRCIMRGLGELNCFCEKNSLERSIMLHKTAKRN